MQICLITQRKGTQVLGSEREGEGMSVKMVRVGAVGKVREIYLGDRMFIINCKTLVTKSV